MSFFKTRRWRFFLVVLMLLTCSYFYHNLLHSSSSAKAQPRQLTTSSREEMSLLKVKVEVNLPKSFPNPIIHGCSQLESAISSQQVQTSATGVTNLIHLVYSDTKVPEKYFELIRNCFQINSPNMLYVLWTNDDARQFISDHYPAEKPSHFDALLFELERSDVIRYFILWHYGGFYMDMDTECRRPLWPLLQQHACLLDREDEAQTQLWHNKPYAAMNSAMGCRPQHPFFRKVLDLLPQNLRKGGNVIDRTGPLYLTDVYNRYTQNGTLNISAADNVTLMPSWAFTPLKDINGYVLADFRKRCEDKEALKKHWVAQGCATWKELDNLGVGDVHLKTKDSYLIHKFLHFGHLGGGGRTPDGQGKIDLCNVPNITMLRYLK